MADLWESNGGRKTPDELTEERVSSGETKITNTDQISKSMQQYWKGSVGLGVSFIFSEMWNTPMIWT